MLSQLSWDSRCGPAPVVLRAPGPSAPDFRAPLPARSAVPQAKGLVRGRLQGESTVSEWGQDEAPGPGGQSWSGEGFQGDLAADTPLIITSSPRYHL